MIIKIFPSAYTWAYTLGGLYSGGGGGGLYMEIVSNEKNGGLIRGAGGLIFGGLR